MEGKLVFKIREDGVVTVEGKEFKGQACLDKARKFFEDLGKVEERKLTPEYYEETAGTQVNMKW